MKSNIPYISKITIWLNLFIFNLKIQGLEAVFQKYFQNKLRLINCKK